MDLHHSNGEDDISLSSSSCSFSTVYEDENERELLLSDTEEEEQNSRLPKRKMAVTRTSYRSKESSQRKKTREVYIQLKKQYLAARMYGGYEEMLILADLLYSLAHPPPSFDLGHSPSSSSHDTLPTSSSSLLPSCSYMICSSSSSLHTRMSKSPVLSSSSSCWRFKSLRKDRSLSPSSTSTSDLSEETQSSLSPSSPPPLSSSLSSFSPPARRHFLSSSSCSHRETASSFLSSSFLSRTLNEEDIHSREEREKKELTDLLRERDVDIETPSSSLREKQAEEEKKKKAFCCEEAPCTPERSEKSEKEVKKKIERAEEEKEEKKKKILERRKKHNDREQREGEIAEGRGRRSCPLYQVESLFYLCEALYACKQWKRLGFLLFSRHLSLLSQHPALLLLASKLLSLKQEHRECILLLQQHRHTWLAQSTSSVPSLLVDALELSLAVALQRAGKFQEALIVLCESYRRQPMQPKLLFALFGSGALRPEEELNLLKATSFSLENLWVKHLTVALISATRGEEPSDIWMKVCSETDLLQSSQQPSSSFSSSCFSSSSPPPPRPPGLQGMPLVVGLGGRCLTVQDVLEYIEDMYPSSHIPPEALYSSVNVTIQAFRAYRKHNLPLALAISDL
ncbi:hypothetical protein CSUI_006701 [Cystoisospora suis]|uniref:Uncharacterized protein n=1 Tax=Cystoisospora suis TaxID=483139 RepID=A0A2C6KT77_9APIC|nr:hypothetical protein CSUI_006701 [Cystoisospora suis]